MIEKFRAKSLADIALVMARGQLDKALHYYLDIGEVEGAKKAQKALRMLGMIRNFRLPPTPYNKLFTAHSIEPKEHYIRVFDGTSPGGAFDIYWGRPSDSIRNALLGAENYRIIRQKGLGLALIGLIRGDVTWICEVTL